MSIQILQETTPAPTVSRPCDICGETFYAKNPQAAFMMTTGKLRVCDSCRSTGAKTELPYTEYLKTEYWQFRRKRALILGDHKCRVCGAKDARLEVHHNTYERLGREEDTDLVVLCRGCHTLFHDNGELRF